MLCAGNAIQSLAIPVRARVSSGVRTMARAPGSVGRPRATGREEKPTSFSLIRLRCVSIEKFVVDGTKLSFQDANHSRTLFQRKSSGRE